MSLDGLDLPPEEIRDATCVTCPAQLLALGTFDVADRPSRETQYDPALGWRVNRMTGAPTCVHPYRVGLPAAAYATGAVALPSKDVPAPVPNDDDLVLPDDPTLLEAWLIAVLRRAPAASLASALYRAEAKASERFASRDVVAAMRRVMSHKLTGC